MSAPQKVRIGDVRTIGVPVGDQEQALSFFVDTLCFEKRLDASLGGGRRWIEVAPPGAAITIALVAASDKAPAGVETGIRFTTADAAAAHAALREQGVTTGDLLRWEGVPPMFSFRDHDGNGFELVEQAG